MSTRVNISIPERCWNVFSGAPKDGSIVFVRGHNEEVDIWRWDSGEWNAEFGTVDIPMYFAEISIARINQCQQ